MSKINVRLYRLCSATPEGLCDKPATKRGSMYALSGLNQVVLHSSSRSLIEIRFTRPSLSPKHFGEEVKDSQSDPHCSLHGCTAPTNDNFRQLHLVHAASRVRRDLFPSGNLYLDCEVFSSQHSFCSFKPYCRQQIGRRIHPIRQRNDASVARWSRRGGSVRFVLGPGSGPTHSCCLLGSLGSARPLVALLVRVLAVP